MKITIDTNVLVRIILQDDINQSIIAKQLLERASLIAISTACLCETVWVLKRKAKLNDEKIITVIENLLNFPKVVLDRPTVENGLKVFKAGGDFADGIIEFEGKKLGGEIFYSFDKKAVSLLKNQGEKVELL